MLLDLKACVKHRNWEEGFGTSTAQFFLARPSYVCLHNSLKDVSSYTNTVNGEEQKVC